MFFLSGFVSTGKKNNHQIPKAPEPTRELIGATECYHLPIKATWLRQGKSFGGFLWAKPRSFNTTKISGRHHPNEFINLVCTRPLDLDAREQTLDHSVTGLSPRLPSCIRDYTETLAKY
jgi:hypothetical protein